MNAVVPGVLYAALLGDAGRLRDIYRLQYRCAYDRRCLMLDAIQVPEPERFLLHQLRYKYSPDENAARSSEDGRKANTVDGDNHWRDRTFYLSSSALIATDDEGFVLGLTCDHVLEYHLKPSEFVDDVARRHTEVRLRADGTRYVVA